MLNGPGLRCSTSAGRMVLQAGAAPAGARKRHGWARTEAGAGYYTELGASAVPATALRFRGIAFTPDGSMYTTNTAPAASAILRDGFAIRLDGALHVNTGALTGKGKGGVNRDNGRVFV